MLLTAESTLQLSVGVSCVETVSNSEYDLNISYITLNISAYDCALWEDIRYKKWVLLGVTVKVP